MLIGRIGSKPDDAEAEKSFRAVRQRSVLTPHSCPHAISIYEASTLAASTHSSLLSDTFARHISTRFEKQVIQEGQRMRLLP